MNKEAHFQSTKNITPEDELFLLKDFITSGDVARWVIRVDDGGSWPFDTYTEALNKFEQIPLKFSARLMLYTRIGIPIIFRSQEKKS